MSEVEELTLMRHATKLRVALDAVTDADKAGAPAATIRQRLDELETVVAAAEASACAKHMLVLSARDILNLWRRLRDNIDAATCQ